MRGGSKKQKSGAFGLRVDEQARAVILHYDIPRVRITLVSLNGAQLSPRQIFDESNGFEARTTRFAWHGMHDLGIRLSLNWVGTGWGYGNIEGTTWVGLDALPRRFFVELQKCAMHSGTISAWVSSPACWTAAKAVYPRSHP